MGSILGVPDAMVQGYHEETNLCQLPSEEATRAAYLIKIIHMLSLRDSDAYHINQWLTTESSELEGIPLDLMKTLPGLKQVHSLLDQA